MGHADRSLATRQPKPILTEEAVEASNTFSQLVLSFLVRTAFPEETQNAEMDNSSAMLDRRLKALNYLGSILSQNVVNLPRKLIMQCLGLVLTFQDKRQ